MYQSLLTFLSYILRKSLTISFFVITIIAGRILVIEKSEKG